MGNGDDYLLGEVDKIILKKETARPNFSKCGVGEDHARNEAEASLMMLKMLRITFAHTMSSKPYRRGDEAGHGGGLGSIEYWKGHVKATGIPAIVLGLLAWAVFENVYLKPKSAEAIAKDAAIQAVELAKAEYKRTH